MPKTLFIADLHLSDDRTDISDLFCHFLAHNAVGADALYILGDLFEVWFGDDNPNPFNYQIAAAIKQLADTGVPVYFIHGNRDFTVGKRFAKASGMTILPEKMVIDLYGHNALIMHGDSLCTLDVAYQKFRKKSRKKWWQAIMLSLPLFYRQKLANDARKRSQENNKEKSQTIMDVTQSEVVSEMQTFNVDLLIHGHTHRPNRHNFDVEGKTFERIVLGDWYEQGSLLEVTPQGMSLINQAFLAND
ncbi:UDP-2,3-diacylglucosamine diphosphatase [Psychrobium sp. 1_MG-2023]|uniref:UDP-2,3-diacylglucosamine diphosphatase n=1 Tax=Psychrobium sp. 1_MG-2023 TaxID=3062624 RepID=UPI000C3455D0|nr:UDP-2,3-diacylglucosamine diphosphatase [Psychrobium sp. 1_MG-2023]MDP2561273.1 UDP-2,3-diacylglucosamine diphosphatase [Psychrobium sp. 1_MG-2023]PKF55227.1 UDP-2,3-diacylglucosamine diphosphatase [Alteromonadales bacterium alter-6D02]